MPKPTKIMPTWRMSSTKQLEVLRAYVAVCGDVPRAVTNAEIAPIVNLKAETVGVANSFFASGYYRRMRADMSNASGVKGCRTTGLATASPKTASRLSRFLQE